MHTLLDKLKKQLHEAIISHVGKLPAGFGADGFYGYAILTDSDVSSLGPVANREEDLKTEPADARYNYFRYCVDEWKHWKDFGAFDDVKDTVGSIHLTSPNEFERNCDSILSVTLEVMSELESGGIFGPRAPGRIIAVWQREPGVIRLKSVVRLNSPEVVKAFTAAKLG